MAFQTFRRLVLALAVVLPLPLKLALYRRLLRWRIGRGVRIGLSYLDARSVVLGDGVHIGHGNVIRGVGQFEVGTKTHIANFNQFFGAAGAGGTWTATLIFGAHVNFMSRHFIDVGGRVEIGSHCIVGGRDTQFWSHTMSFQDSPPILVPTEVCVGESVYIGAHSMLVSCRIPDGAVIGAGSVVAKSFPAEADRLLIAGNPAAIRKRYTQNAPPSAHKPSRKES